MHHVEFVASGPCLPLPLFSCLFPKITVSRLSCYYIHVKNLRANIKSKRIYRISTLTIAERTHDLQPFNPGVDPLTQSVFLTLPKTPPPQICIYTW